MPVELDYQFGKAAVASGALTQEQLEECIEVLVALERVGTKKRLWDVVARKGYMGEAAIARLRGGKAEAPAPEEPHEAGEETAEHLPVPAVETRGMLVALFRKNGQWRIVPLPERTLNIGPGRESDIVVDDPEARGQLARLRFEDNGFIAEDIGRGTGLIINDARVNRVRLRPNDLMLFGNSKLLFLAEYDTESAPEPTSAGAVEGGAVVRLECVGGPRQGTEFFLGARPLVAGRSPLANVRLTEEAVADFHCQIACTREGVRVADLCSAGGTLVNDERIDTRLLKQKDVLVIGGNRFRLGFLKSDVPGAVEFQVTLEAEVEPETNMLMRKRLFGEMEPVDKPAPKPYKPGQLRLVGLEGPVENKRILIKRAKTVFGRDPKADVPLNDAAVSRKHAEIVLEKTQATLRDAKSRNGTYLNGAKISKPMPLRPGDAIRIGSSLMVVEEVK